MIHSRPARDEGARAGRRAGGPGASAALDRPGNGHARLSVWRRGPIRAGLARSGVAPRGVDRVEERGSAPRRSALGHDTGRALHQRALPPEARLSEWAGTVDLRRPLPAGGAPLPASGGGTPRGRRHRTPDRDGALAGRRRPLSPSIVESGVP